MNRFLFSSTMFILLLYAACTQVSTSQKQKELDFRKAAWGMSKKEVRQSETANFYSESEREGVELLAYKGELLGMGCHIGYVFARDKLVRAKYFAFDEQHITQQSYLRLRDLLIQKYGEPSFVMEEIETMPLAEWQTPDTNIGLSLMLPEDYSRDMKPDMVLEYSSVTHKDDEKKAKEQNALSNL